MKTRIYKKNGKYYPQYKVFLFWEYFYLDIGYKYADNRETFPYLWQAEDFLMEELRKEGARNTNKWPKG